MFGHCCDRIYVEPVGTYLTGVCYKVSHEFGKLPIPISNMWTIAFNESMSQDDLPMLRLYMTSENNALYPAISLCTK